jgi:serine/threonine-protein kinase
MALRDKKFFAVDAGLGLAVTCFLLLAAQFKPTLTENIESLFYDLRLSFAPRPPVSGDIRVVVVDNASIESEGRWPWPRSKIGDLVAKISAGGPRAVGLNILYVDPDKNEGLAVVKEIQGLYEESKATLRKKWPVPKRNRGKRPGPDPLAALVPVEEAFEEAIAGLDHDARLAEALELSPGVVLPLSFTSDKSLADEGDESLDRLKARSLTFDKSTPWTTVREGFQPLLPLDIFSHHVSGLGHVNVFADPDGTVRRESPVVRYRGHFIPSYALEIARVALGLGSDKIKVNPGVDISLGKTRIPLDEQSRFLVRFPKGSYLSNMISAHDVLEDKVPPKVFKNKIVIVGLEASGVGSFFVTPWNPLTSDSGLELSVVQNILEGNYLSRPAWAGLLELGELVFLGLFVTLLLPRLKAAHAAVVSILLLGLIAGGGTYLFMAKGYWTKVFYPMALLGAGYVVITGRRFFFTEKRRELAEAQGIETNKQLGVSFQGQGMLDMAFEKFQKCPVDDDMKGLLYNLALDFERKRQFNKAAVVYDHIAKADPKFKDVADRRKAAQTAGETMIMGGGLGAKRDGGTLVMGGAAAKPTLGRYEIQKELGRGAMGVVYLGKDPKINRSVAIKTLRFDDETDPESSKMIKERFFREAESAGTLNHPNIIRIFDAGEDGDVSYIAMELLEGEDLKKYGDKKNLLPVSQVLDYAVAIADALDYAHANGVVHRDIKPANVMRLKDGTLRVTDFGIARITASSKTQTGTVLGTPSYMSPESIAGKKVDGRADLFSLGVMLYELLTGTKPFDGDSLTTLLFKIANEPHPDPLGVAPERVSPAVKAVIDIALAKNPDQRYPKAVDMARDLRAAAANPAAPDVTGDTQKLGTSQTIFPSPKIIPSSAPSGHLLPQGEKGIDVDPSRERPVQLPPVSILENTVPLRPIPTTDPGDTQRL